MALNFWFARQILWLTSWFVLLSGRIFRPRILMPVFVELTPSRRSSGTAMEAIYSVFSPSICRPTKLRASRNCHIMVSEWRVPWIGHFSSQSHSGGVAVRGYVFASADAHVFEIAALSLDWTQGKLSAAWFPEGPKIQTSGLEMKFWKLRRAVDTLKCWVYPGLQHIALSFTLSCWTLWGPLKPCLPIYFVVRLLLLFLHKCLLFDLWDVCLTKTDKLFKMFPTMIPCKVGTMHSTSKTSLNSWSCRSLELDTGLLCPGIIILEDLETHPQTFSAKIPKAQPNSI